MAAKTGSASPAGKPAPTKRAAPRTAAPAGGETPRPAETIRTTAVTGKRAGKGTTAPRGTSSRRGKTTARKAAPPPTASGFALPQPLQREILAVLICLTAVLTFISLSLSGARHPLGVWGDILAGAFGWAAWVVPVAIAAAGIMLFRAGIHRLRNLHWEMPLGLVLILAAAVGLLELPIDDKLAAAQQNLGGGWAGYYASAFFEGLAGPWGAAVILLALAVIGAILAFHLSVGQMVGLFGRGGRGLVTLVTTPPADPAAPDAPARRPHVPAERDGLPADLPAPYPPPLPGRLTAPPAALDGAARVLGSAPASAAPEKPARKAKTSERPPTTAAPPLQIPLPEPAASGMFWKLPELTLLERSSEAEIDDGELARQGKHIEETLGTFGVAASFRGFNKGPAVTQFAIVPGEGVRVAKISALANDLARALAAPGIRIEAPVPGRDYVGIEVPNAIPGLVGLRNILETETFQRSRAHLRFPIGRDTNNQPVVTDLAKLPHLLIAGATGSGKSVAINALIISFLMQYTPEQLRMLMIDPKRVELSGFNGVPHLLRPVVTEMKHEKEPSRKGPRELTAIEVLKWLLWEMERRYKVFARGIKTEDGTSRIFRNIEQFHAAARGNPAMEAMPYIVLIIDELADLMLVSPEDVETALCRLAQLARATGIHLIIATQRPSVDVVTGLIKANFPARMAFAVTSMIDSRVILDTPGAEKLLGRGDALYTASDEFEADPRAGHVCLR